MCCQKYMKDIRDPGLLWFLTKLYYLVFSLKFIFFLGKMRIIRTIPTRLMKDNEIKENERTWHSV